MLDPLVGTSEGITYSTNDGLLDGDLDGILLGVGISTVVGTYLGLMMAYPLYYHWAHCLVLLNAMIMELSMVNPMEYFMVYY